MYCFLFSSSSSFCGGGPYSNYSIICPKTYSDYQGLFLIYCGWLQGFYQCGVLRKGRAKGCLFCAAAPRKIAVTYYSRLWGLETACFLATFRSSSHYCIRSLDIEKLIFRSAAPAQAVAAAEVRARKARHWAACRCLCLSSTKWKEAQRVMGKSVPSFWYVILVVLRMILS